MSRLKLLSICSNVLRKYSLFLIISHYFTLFHIISIGLPMKSNLLATVMLIVVASNFEAIAQQEEVHQHGHDASLQQIALNNGWLTKQQVLAAGQSMSKNAYGQYLVSLVEE